MPASQGQTNRQLEVLPGSPDDAGLAVTWVLARRGERVVVESRWLDRLATFAAALGDEPRMARYQIDAPRTRRRVKLLSPASRVDVIVHAPGQPGRGTRQPAPPVLAGEHDGPAATAVLTFTPERGGGPPALSPAAGGRPTPARPPAAGG